MKHLIPIIALLALSVPAFSQARVTDCSPTTPNNALCVTWTAPATNTDGTPTVLPLTYRIEQKLGATGTWTTVNSTITTTRAYMTNLIPGTYFFRVFVNCAGCTESAPSNEGSKAATAQPPQVNPPTITIAVVISPDAPPTVVQVNGSDVYASTKP